MFSVSLELFQEDEIIYGKIAREYLYIGDLQNAAHYFEEELRISEKLSEQDLDMLASIYERFAVEAEKNGNMDESIEYYEKLLALRPNADLQKLLDVKRNTKMYIPKLEDLARNIAVTTEYDFHNTEILSDEFIKFTNTLEEPYIFLYDGLYIGVYPNGYVYYGEMSNGKREGHAKWIHGTETYISIVDGTWKDDMPNGIVTITGISNREKIERKKGETYAYRSVETGNVNNGIFEGKANKVWYMEDGHIHDWDVTYIAGSMQSIGISASGKNNAAICKNCSANLLVSDYIHKVGGLD